jgi:hypothetical protein
VGEIHRVVPEYADRLGPPTDRLLDQLKAGRPVWRMNWGVRASDQLDQSPRYADELRRLSEGVTPQNAGHRCFFRVERQTLARLSASGHLLFAIHTHQCPLQDLDRQRRGTLAGVIESCPLATLRYKGIEPMRAAIVAYLRATEA